MAIPAQYVEPGTFSLLLQILLVGGLAGLVAIKVFWQRLVGLASRVLGRTRKQDGKE